MGCDIEYYLDHDFIGLSAAEFLAEFKKRIAPLPLMFTGMDDSPYSKNEPLSNCWEIDCFLYDFETAYSMRKDCGITIRLHQENRSHAWELFINPKTMCFSPFGDEFNFLHGTHRWREFREEYLMNRNPEIETNIQTTFEEIKKYIVPLFHSTKLIAIGDQGLHEEMGAAIDEGASIEESFGCAAVKDAGCHVAVYRHGEDNRFSYADKKKLPVWMSEFFD